MRGLTSLLPPDLAKVFQEFVCHREAEAEERGVARGKAAAVDEMTAAMRFIARLMPASGCDAPALPSAVSTMVAVAKPEPTVMLAEDAAEPAPEPVKSVLDDDGADDDVMMGLEAAGGADSLAGVLDELFGAYEWSDLDRRELLRFVMAGVTEAMMAKGRDPEPVLEILRSLENDPASFDAVAAGGGEQWLSWQAVPLRNPRKEFRFLAHNPETGTKKYGKNAIDTMRSHNADKFKFADGERMPFEAADEKTLLEHTEAYRRAK